MSCLCPLRFSPLMDALVALPPLGTLVPALPLNLVASLQATLPALGPVGLNAGLAAATSGSGEAALVAQLSVMASLNAAMKAAMGIGLTQPLSASAAAALQAGLSANIHGLNACGPLLALHMPALSAQLTALLTLTPLLGLLALQASLGIDLRAPGAVVALQARLDAAARLALTAQVAVAATATARLSLVETLMATLGVPLTAQGALTLNAAAQACAGLTLGLPPITVNLQALGLVVAITGLLRATLSILKVDLRAPQAMANLRAALQGLPLAALAQLRVAALATATVSAAASASAAAAASASTQPALNLSGVAQASLGAAARLALLLQLTSQASFLLAPPGLCGATCPGALVAALPA